MSIQLKVPSLGESVTQATIGAWLKNEGERVQVDEPLVEVESEKATVAVPAPAAGVLRRVLKRTGDTVAVGEAIAELEEGAAGETAAASPQGSGPVPGGLVPVARGDGQAAVPPPAVAATPPAPAPPAAEHSPAQPPSAARRAPPSARRLMAEHGLDVGAVAGSGPGGQVRKEDVVRALERPAEARGPAPAPQPRPPTDGAAARERVVPMTSLRRTVARRLVEAQQTAAILTTFNEVDMSRVLALREKHGESFLAKHGVKLGFMSFFVKAAVEALRAFPSVNAEVRGDRHRLQGPLRHRRRGGRRQGARRPGRARRGRALLRGGGEARSASSRRRRGTTASRWTTSPAGRSRSRTAASTARCSRRPS